ncbi:GspH/FimT family pseudopilin [Omnitrophica bacterium]|nr:GspH/FimT family pseudopilin [Candidatus Omnitrophota bacterium]
MISPIGRRLNRAGFTLIELILLTVIIATLVAISTPLFRNTYSSLKLRDASFNLAKLINFAQEKAIIEGVPYKLILDTKDARYYFTKLDEAGSGEYKRLEDRLGRVFPLPQGAKLKASKKEIVFYPDGHSEKATITLSGKGKRIKMSIRGKLGYVEIALGK